jgi:hypothetical protein
MRTVAMPPSTFASVLSNLFIRPWTIVRLWNWKSAVLSLSLRLPVFVVASVRRGLTATLSAAVTEFVFCAATSGFYGSICQSFRLAEPRWLTLLFLTLILPGLFQALEYLMHRTGGTPHLRIAEIFSCSISILSALFNWYAMRRDALLVGPEGDRFGSDLARLPRLLLNFIIFYPRRWLARRKSTPLHPAG